MLLKIPAAPLVLLPLKVLTVGEGAEDVPAEEGAELVEAALDALEEAALEDETPEVVEPELRETGTSET